MHLNAGNVSVQFCRLKHCLTLVKEKLVKDSLSETTSEQVSICTHYRLLTALKAWRHMHRSQYADFHGLS